MACTSTSGSSHGGALPTSATPRTPSPGRSSAGRPTTSPPRGGARTATPPCSLSITTKTPATTRSPVRTRCEVCRRRPCPRRSPGTRSTAWTRAGSPSPRCPAGSRSSATCTGASMTPPTRCRPCWTGRNAMASTSCEAAAPGASGGSSAVGVLVVGDVLPPVQFGALVSGDGLGDGQVGHEVAGRGAVPVPLICRRVDDVAGADLGDVAAAGLDEPSPLGDVQGLPDSVGMPCGAGGGTETDRADPDARGFLTPGDAVDPDISGEPIGRAFDGRLLGLDFHGGLPCRGHECSNQVRPEAAVRLGQAGAPPNPISLPSGSRKVALRTPLP